MQELNQIEAVIIGAGVVGLATAAKLAQDGRSVLVLERHSRHGTETSSRNSEVVHAGIYYPKDSIKSRLCHAGRKKIYALAEEGKIYAKKTGKLIVAVTAEEANKLKNLKETATQAGAQGLQILSKNEAEARVPGLKTEAALWSPESGIVDSEELMGYFRKQAEGAGAIFLFKSELTQAQQSTTGWVLSFGNEHEEVKARWVINAGGLHGDKIAALAGPKPGLKIHWCKGTYFRLRTSINLNHLVYPMPGHHGLGVHLTVDRAGGVRLGPDAEFVDKIDYEINPAKAESFRKAVAAYWPQAANMELLADTAGIRPKLTGPEEGFKDFHIGEDYPGWINLMGIESPGLTASPAIADLVADIIGKN